jgi:hypothetical protein
MGLRLMKRWNAGRSGGRLRQPTRKQTSWLVTSSGDTANARPGILYRAAMKPDTTLSIGPISTLSGSSA